jgi:hypothetical protein
MRTVIKTIITTVLLPTLLAMAGTVEARLKYYRYNDNIPMVEMSLNMMVAMGVLEPIPSRLVHDGNPYHRMVNASYGPYSRSGYSTYPERSRRYSNYRYNDYLDGPIDPYDSYYGGYNDRYYGSRYGYSPEYQRYRTWGSQWDSPWADRWDNQWDSPWGNTWGSPWDYQQGSPWSSSWGSPWGNQWSNPWNSGRGNQWGNQWNNPWSSGRGNQWGNQWNSPWSSGRGNQWGNQWNNPWSSGWGNQWGNQWNSPWSSGWGSPWGNQWNNPWMNPWSSQSGYSGAWPYTPGYSNLPLSPGINTGDDWSKNNSYQSDDASRQNPGNDGYKAEKTSWFANPSSMRYRHSGHRKVNNRPYRKLNGLWIGDNGAMLGIRGNRFLWYDDDNQYAKGQLVKSPTMMKARIEGSATVVRYHYQLHGNELVIMSRDGKMHTFNRMPLVELPVASARPHAAYTSYKPESSNYHFSYASYRSGQKLDRSSLNLRNNSDRVGRAAGANRSTHSPALRENHSREYYSDERSTARSRYLPNVVNGSRDDGPSVSRPADPDSDFYTGEAFINNAGQKHLAPLMSAGASSADPAATIPLYKKYQPASGRAKSDNGADSAAQTAEDIRVESSTWTDYAGLDMNDPNTYLYSYLKDNDNKRTSASDSTDTDNSDGSVRSALADQSDSSNIWKPNNSYPDRRGYIENSQSDNSAQNTGQARSVTANSDMKGFAWPAGGTPWD